MAIMKRNLKHVEHDSKDVMDELSQHWLFADSDFDVLKALVPSFDEDDGQLLFEEDFAGR